MNNPINWTWTQIVWTKEIVLSVTYMQSCPIWWLNVLDINTVVIILSNRQLLDNCIAYPKCMNKIAFVLNNIDCLPIYVYIFIYINYLWTLKKGTMAHHDRY